jgi:hypothetical protein
MRGALAALVGLLATATPAFADPDPQSRFFFGMGLMVRKAPSELGNLAGVRGTPYLARTVEAPRALFDHDVGMRWRAGLVLRAPLFVAVDVGMGVTALPDSEQPAAPMQTGSSGTVLGVMGVRGDLAATALGVELATGFRHATYCIGESAEQHDVYSTWQSLAELRVRAERRLGRSALIGATLGTSLIDRGAWIGSIDVTFRPLRVR